jgi:hypothetical protein
MTQKKRDTDPVMELVDGQRGGNETCSEERCNSEDHLPISVSTNEFIATTF